jgi:gluconate 2-dehydrogenase gamma chain
MSDEDTKKPSGAISRRDLLKVISVAPAALVPLAPAAVAAVKPQAAASAAQTAASAAPKIFDPHQWKTIQVLCDLIIPADERSGSATQAGVPQFMDDWLHLKGGREKTETMGALMWMDVECNRLFDHDFVDCSPARQKQILDRIAYPETAAPEDSNAVAAFSYVRDLVMSGFYSSEVGIKDLQYAGNKALPSWDGCPEEALSRLGVDYSNWKYWNKPANT